MTSGPQSTPPEREGVDLGKPEPTRPFESPPGGPGAGGYLPPPTGALPPPPPPPAYGGAAYGGGAYGGPAYAYGVSPQAPYGVHPASGIPYSDKQKLVAGLLQIFLGGFGIGRFYIGDTRIAVLQIVVTVLTCGIGSLWGLIDGILMLVNDQTLDANGYVLRP